MLFPYKLESKKFGNALLDVAMRVHKDNISHMVSENNTHTFRHGRRWLILRETEIEESSFKKVGVDLFVEYEKILKNDVSHFFNFLESFVEGFSSQTTQILYQTISDSCEMIGNTVDRRDFTSDAETFLAMIKMIDFCVGDDGQVHLPQIHMGPDKAGKFLQNLEEQGEEFKLEVDKVIKEKTQAAWQKEEQRLDKFKGLKK